MKFAFNSSSKSPLIKLETGIVILILVASSPSANANLITNSSFEVPAPPNGGYTTFAGGSNSLNGWSVLGNGILSISTAYSEPGITFPAEDGVASVDLTAYGNTGLANGVSQSIPTVIGQSYEVSFYVGRGHSVFNGSYLTPSSVDLSINGGSRVSYTNNNVSTGTVNWTQFTAIFAASSTSTNIAFFNGTTSNYFAGLDNVQVSAVPVPAAVWLFGSGVTVLVSWGRKRRR